MQVGCCEAVWAVQRLTLVFLAKYGKGPLLTFPTCPLVLGSPKL